MTEISTVARLRYTGNESGLTVGDIRAFCEMLDQCDDSENLTVIGTVHFVVEALILLADRED
jgi:hypothetical protein